MAKTVSTRRREMLTAGQAARICGRSESSIRAYSRTGKLKYARTANGRRYDRIDIEAFAKTLKSLSDRRKVLHDGRIRCARCNQGRDPEEFDRMKGSTGRQSYCIDCRRDVRYGLEAGLYQKLLSSQLGLCAICGRPEETRNRSGKVKPLSVDHDHLTGHVRGLLCHHCNVGIARFNDDLSLLQAAVDYLSEA